jgi:hypothetical protein
MFEIEHFLIVVAVALALSAFTSSPTIGDCQRLSAFAVRPAQWWHQRLRRFSRSLARGGPRHRTLADPEIGLPQGDGLQSLVGGERGPIRGEETGLALVWPWEARRYAKCERAQYQSLIN